MLNAKLYAQLCQAAYSAPPDIEVHQDFQAITRITDDGWCCAIRGTDGFAKALLDLDIETVPVGGLGHVHRGFWEATAEAFDYVLIHHNAQARKLPILLTGHSFGGAVALILAAQLARRGIAMAGVVTFGAPRVSVDTDMEDILRLAGMPVWMFTHAADRVPMLPPEDLGWRHPAPQIQVGKPLESWIEDHSIAEYIAAL